jgi:hypothetical protein
MQGASNLSVSKSPSEAPHLHQPATHYTRPSPPIRLIIEARLDFPGLLISLIA